MDLHEFKRLGLTSLVVLDRNVALIVLVGGDVIVDRAHHVPGAGDLHAARMLLNGEPPPCHRQACHHNVTVALFFRTLLHPDVHEFELIPFRLEPEVDGVLLLGLVLVVEDGVGEPAIARHAAHDLDLVEYEVEVGVELGVVEDEGAVLAPLIDCLLNGSVYVLLGEGLARTGRRSGWLGLTSLIPLRLVRGPRGLCKRKAQRRCYHRARAPPKPSFDRCCT